MPNLIEMPNLHNMTLNKKSCLTEVAKLRNLVAMHTVDIDTDFRGLTIRVLEHDIVRTYFVTQFYENYSYRVLDLLTEERHTKFIQKLNREGKVFVCVP